MKHAIIGKNGELIVPEEMRIRYHLEPDIPVRLVETKVGILIIPLNEPPSEETMEELAAWQRVGLASWERFS
ncbi:MAG: hypothetical protein K6U12_12115 [Armatimonadetes bacterium]|jgi:bifunctional DNA-binding transcriptional regulator/antitoxin component of YhaV-PrlF toxin-antitoxin module|nr:hypothetical protein [Armatimonadota bacterium]GIV13120.1 MAG: hypothetical protein KatS3mg021_1402 [Fimbriimonadales bacterium]CUU10903.1 hypothetical protein GBSOP10_10843 [Armatimonadetes bacterium GBS]CUU36678.1 hypothetical protein DCOP10_118132 [Armatimonadetes bacterium DC]CUU38343.1 hypothetical protein GXSOP10_1383 [Armatimonadetes bacterium GXS]